MSADPTTAAMTDLPETEDGSCDGGVRLPRSPQNLPHPRVKKPPPTHFLSLPLHHTDGLQDALDALAADIRVQFPGLNIPADAYRPARCCHLTLGVMSLPTPEDVARAAEVLAALDVPALMGQDHQEPLRIALKGVATMGPARKTSVLYVPPIDVGATGRLQRFAEAVRQVFLDAGLMEYDQHRGGELKLHVTVVNTVYVRRGGRGKNRRPLSLDLREVVQAWGADRVFVEELAVERVAVCIMGARELSGVKGGAGYEEVAVKML